MEAGSGGSAESFPTLVVCRGGGCWWCSKAQAELTLHLGPAAIGGGGANPLSIPPVNPLEYELVWLTDSHTEWSFGIVPGFLYGYRSAMGYGAYLSLGGGLVINRHGGGPGVYAAFGYSSCAWFCFNIEYKKAIGILPGMLIDPYAIRLGAVFFKD